MSLEFNPCGAINHARECDGKGVSVDHIVPKCVGKLLGWTPEQIGSIDNKQLLSHACHVAIDSNTRRIYYELRLKVRKGVPVTEEEVKDLFHRLKLNS